MRCLTVMAGLALGVLQAGAIQPLALVQTIELSRVEGRIDHLAYDAAGQRLFVAALGNNTVEVLDLKKGSHLKSLTGFREPQGLAFLPDLNAIAVANGQGKGVQVVNGTDYRMGTIVSLGDDADNVRYDAAAKRTYTGYGGGALAAFNPSDGKVLGQVKLAGHPESFQLERSGSRLYVNVPTAGHIAVVDRTSMTIIARWPVTGARANYPMALDEANHRLFVGCRRPAKVLVYDTSGGKETGSFEIVGDTDDLFYDAEHQRVYVSGGEGFIDVVQAKAGAPFSRLARIPTAGGARTSLFVPELGRLFLAVPHRGTQPAEIRIYEAGG